MKKERSMIKNISNAFGFLLLAGMGTLAVPKSADAQVAVACVTCMVPLNATQTSTAAIATSTAAMNTTLGRLQLYLQTGVGGTGTSMGGGIIEQLQSLNDTFAELSQKTSDNVSNNDSLNKIRDYRKANNNIDMTHMPSDYNQSCSDASLASSFATGGGATGGGGAPSNPGAPKAAPPSNSGDVVYAVRNVVRDRNYSANATKGSQMLAHNGSGGGLNFCTDNDGTYTRLGCTKAGDYPGGDTDASNLITGAQKPGVTTTAIPTLNDEQLKVASAVINNIVPQVPAGLPKNASKNPVANAYNVDANNMKSRISVLDLALTNAVAFYGKRIGMPTEALTTWKGSAAEYKKVYGANTLMPEVPSLYQQYDFEIMRRMADPDWVATLNSKDPKDIAADGVKVQVLQARIQLDQLAESKKTNLLLSVLAAQSLDPHTTEELKSRLSSISTAGN